MSFSATALDVVVLVVGALAAGALAVFVLGLPLMFWRLPARLRIKLAERGLTHVLQTRFLTETGAGIHGSDVELHRRRTWFPTLLGRRLVFVYAGPPRRRALLFNHSRKLRRQPVWSSITLSPAAAHAWLADARVWYRPLDRAIAVDRDYAGDAKVIRSMTLLALVTGGDTDAVVE